MRRSKYEARIVAAGLGAEFRRDRDQRRSERRFQDFGELAQNGGEVIGEAVAEVGQDVGGCPRHESVDHRLPAVGKAPIEGRTLDFRALRDGREGAGLNPAFDQQLKDCLMDSVGDIAGATTRPTP